MPRKLFTPRQQAHLKEVLTLIDDQEMSTQWLMKFHDAEPSIMIPNQHGSVRPSDKPTRDDLFTYKDYGVVEIMLSDGHNISFRYRRRDIADWVRRQFYEREDESMPKYPLTEKQLDYLRKLVPLFEDGMSAQWSIAEGGDGIVGIIPIGNDCPHVPPETTKEDLYAYADARLAEMRTEPNGRITLFRFLKEFVLYAVLNDGKLHHLHNNGGTSMNINIGGDNIGGNIGIDSRFDNIAQTISVSTALSDDLKSSVEALFKQLGEELAKIPDSMVSNKADIEIAAEDLSNELSAPTPHKQRLESRIRKLKEAAGNVLEIAPVVTETAVKIALALAPLLK